MRKKTDNLLRHILMLLAPAALLWAQEPPSGASDSVSLRKDVLRDTTDTMRTAAPAQNRNLFEKIFGLQGATIKKDSAVTGQEDITRIGEASDHPDRSPKAIHDVASTYLENIRHCYLKRLEMTPALKGEMMVTFDITWQGKVQNLRVVRSTLPDKNLEKCAVDRIGVWKFKEIPQAAGDVTVAYPFRFYP